MRPVRHLFIYTVLSVMMTAAIAGGQDWSQWRGPARDGVTGSFRPPSAWPDKLKLRWRVPVGIGHASPVVSGKRVFQFSRQDEQEVAACLDLESGRVLWRDSYPVSYTMNPAATGHGKGPKSTPVVAGNKLYTLGISGVLSCYDASTGKVVWRKEFSKQFKSTSPLYGVAMSPIVEGGLVIAHVGGQDGGALMAFDAESGRLKWTWNGDGPGYASPILVEAAGVRQVVTQTQQNIIGVALSTGRLLWRIPFSTEYVQNIITPVVFKQMIILSGVDKETTAIRIVKSGASWQTEQVWKNDQVSMYMSSPVVSGHLLVGLSHKKKGQFFCLDARTGKTLWTSEGRDGDNAAIIAAGDLILALTTDADLIVSRKSASGLEPVKRYSVAENATWAHPAVAGNQILIKDVSNLALWSFD
ncbi:MAG: hypothetical protein DMF61_22625 [Blastocatellia bacterium AA13]|nr:MAG: hypothetical protein DMF61_22625 [Blastocatellia bacterium AA13]